MSAKGTKVRVMNLSAKTCTNCKKQYVPTSGAQVYCFDCKTKCISCGEDHLYKLSGPHECRKCSCINSREYKRVCKKCSKEFIDRNNKSLFCKDCNLTIYPSNCNDCGSPISKYAFRCNSCNAKFSNRGLFTKGWKRHEFNGIRYRSTWEVEFAKVINTFGIPFEYEKYDKVTRTRPDFFFPDLGFYVEIHPDVHGLKRIPDNCILVKTKEHALAIAHARSLRANFEEYDKYAKTLTKKQLKSRLRHIMSVAIILKTKLMGQES